MALFWLSFCALLLLLNLLASLALALFPAARGAPLSDHVAEALARVYSDWSEDEIAQLVEESAHSFVPEALAQFRERPFAGRFVNTDPNGFRVGEDQGPWPPSKQHFNVFFFGGSTALGYGVPDDDTIPSQLQQALAALDLARPPRVYNFARGAFYSTQERLLFDKLVTLGERPDLAVFLDGLNDFFFREDPPPLTLDMTRKVAEELERPWLAVLRSLPVSRWFQQRQAVHRLKDGKPRKIAADPAADRRAADAAIERYVHNKGIIEALAASRGIPVAFVWQPAPTYRYDLEYHVHDGPFGGHELSRVGYPRMRERSEGNALGENFLWCADLQADARELLYVDLVHYSPRFSEQIARCIAGQLAARGLLD